MFMFFSFFSGQCLRIPMGSMGPRRGKRGQDSSCNVCCITAALCHRTGRSSGDPDGTSSHRWWWLIPSMDVFTGKYLSETIDFPMRYGTYKVLILQGGAPPQ